MTSYSPVKLLWLLPLFLLSACVEPYDPTTKQPATDFLVVEGLINTSEEASTIRLSRTQGLEEEGERVYENNAQVLIETETGDIFSLLPQEKGKYSAAGIDFHSYKHCRLRIKTADGNAYESDYVPVIQTPEIDSISWKADAEGLHIHISTHDPDNNTLYYRWELTETAQYTSAFYSNYIWSPEQRQVVLRPEEEQIFTCWQTHQYDQILVGTSSGLQQDVISEQRLLSLPPDSWKHAFKYSALVKQFGISEEAYQYWDNIKKTTEEVGSLFDPQPSAIQGNIRSVTRLNEPVMGFFSISSSSERRIFIDSQNLPDWNRSLGYPNGSCGFESVDTVFMNDIPANTDKLWINPVEVNGALVGYQTNSPGCIDCRRRRMGGSNVAPDFWK